MPGIPVIDSERQRMIDISVELNGLNIVIANAESRRAVLLEELDRVGFQRYGQVSGAADPMPEDEESVDENADSADQLSVVERVRLYFVEHPTAVMTAPDLFKAGVPAELARIRQALHRLKDRGILKKNEPGVYALAPGQEKSAAA